MWEGNQRRDGVTDRTSAETGEGSSSTSGSDGNKAKFYIGSDEEDDSGAKGAAAFENRTPQADASSRCLIRQRAAVEPRNDDAWLVAGHKVVQWVNRLEVIEDKIKKREANLKRLRAHLEAAKRYMVDFTNPVWNGTSR